MMSIKTSIKEHCPEFLLPLLRITYHIATTPYRRIKHSMKVRMVTERALKYLPYYQDELSREILNERLRYIKTEDKNIFLALTERIGIMNGTVTLIEFPEGKFESILAVYDDENSNDFKHMQRLMPLSDWSGRYRFMKLKDFLRRNEFPKKELITCTLSLVNQEKIKRFIAEKNLQDRFKAGPLYAMRNDLQYLDMFSPVDDEIMIDAGAYDGMTALRFLNWGSSKIKRIYSLELDPMNVPKCEANLRGHEDKVTLIPKGTWSKNETIYINASGGTGSGISHKGATPVELAAIDDVVGDEKVTFIKMDVEGAELESLKGAKNTIMKNHPRLAICAYHKIEDLYELPQYILSIVPEYKFYLRHYCSREWETVLYAYCN